MSEIILARPVLDPETEIARLARRYASAGGLGIQVLNTLGTGADGLLDRLPAPVRGQLDSAARVALTQALRAASGSRQVVPDQAQWLNSVVSTAMGAAGGFGGLADRLGRTARYNDAAVARDRRRRGRTRV